MRSSSGIQLPSMINDPEYRLYQKTLEGAINHRLFKGGGFPKQLPIQRIKKELPDELLEKVSMRVKDIRLN